MRPFFSILIPVFNKAGQMDDCIRSITEQAFTDFEVLFVDDGSTDDSAQEIGRFCEEDSRMRLIRHEKNSSVMTARYTGMQNAEGEYILFIDSDDRFSPDAFESLHALLTGTPVDIVRFDIIEEPKMWVRPAGECPEGVLAAFMKARISPTVWKNCYSSEVIRKAVSRISPFYSNMAEDLFLSAVFYDCAQSFAVLGKVLYHYQTGSGMSTSRKVLPGKMKRDMDGILAVADHLYAYVDQYCPQFHADAERQIRRAMRYVFINSIWEDEDPVNQMEVVYSMRGGRTQWLYEEICRDAIPALVRKRFGLTDRKMDLAGAVYERFTWFED